MNHVVVSDGAEYKVVKIREMYKNHIHTEDINTKAHKKYETKQQVFVINSSDIASFMDEVNTIISTIDCQLIFDLIDVDEVFTIGQLSQLYFGDNYSEAQQLALLQKLSLQLIDFSNKQNASFSKNSEHERHKVIANINQAKLEMEQFKKYYDAFKQLDIADIEPFDVVKFLNNPNKNSVLYKAVNTVCLELGCCHLELMHKANLVPKLEDFFIATFMRDNFPHGVNYSTVDELSDSIFTNLEYNDKLRMFSIDDSDTTEIDDAFSVDIIEDGYIIGIHIAAPALNLNVKSMVCDNLSTIYYPGKKLTMLPQEVITQFSLIEDNVRPVVSIYFDVDNEFNIRSYDSKVEMATVAANLRIAGLEVLFNSESLIQSNGYAYETELKILYNFAEILEARRGKPSVNKLFIDYSFVIDGEKIKVIPRHRGNPIDKLVSELMILANGTWGRMLTNAFVPAIYRVKQPNQPVRMTLIPESHSGLNVDYYTWATSPLRRSVDYINQIQIISLVTQSKNHLDALDTDMLNIVENFDSKYSKYLKFQSQMERYWSLRFLLQEQIEELTGVFLFRSKVQLSLVPLEIDITGIINPRPKGSQIKLKVYNINLARMSFDYKILEST